MNRKTDIAYIISHGFAARMLLQTDLLGKLLQKGLKVAIITPDKNDQNLLDYAKDKNIEIIEFSPQSTLWTGEYIRLRKYLFEDIRKNPALWEKHLRDLDAAKQRASFRLLFKIRCYYFIYLLVRTFPFLKKLLSGFERWSLKDPVADEIIRQLNPGLLIATFPVNLSESRLLFAGNKATETRTVIHLLSWDNITCKGYFPQLADYYISWGDIMKQEFIGYYKIREQKIYNTGVSHFDLHIQVRGSVVYKQLLSQKGLNPEIPYLFFAMSSPYFSPYEIDVVEWLAQGISQNKFGELQLVVRPHPQNMGGSMADESWIGRLKNIQSKKVAVDWPKMVESKLNWSMQSGDMLDFAHLLEGCKISINSGSTVSIDSMLHKKPVILTFFDADKLLPWWQSIRRLAEYKHYKKLIELNGVTPVFSFIEFKNELNRYLENDQYQLTERQNALYQEIGPDDGNATERVVSAIEQIMKENN
jgi:hypothetical protein